MALENCETTYSMPCDFILLILVRYCPGQPTCNDNGICNNQTGTCNCKGDFYGDSCESKIL